MAQPNILLITWHDAGRWFGCYGNAKVHTPHVDRLASQGVRFANMFSACAICSPSRAAIATGRHCQANGVMFLTNTVNNNRMHRDERHIARVLRESHGYHTALFGVQHECAHEHVHEVLAVHEQYDTDPWPTADVSAERLCWWLRSRTPGNRPFYAQWGLYESHLGHYLERGQRRPMVQVEQDVLIPPYLRDTPEARRAVGYLQGMLRFGDEQIGRVLDTLRETGLERDTLVIMCVDHGVGLPRAKTTCYDPGLAVSWLMRWPGVIPEGRVVEAMATHVDVLPTVFELAGWQIPPTVQGKSFAGHVRGTRSDELNDAVFSHMVETIRSVRTHRYKFIRNLRPPRWATVAPPVDLSEAMRVFDSELPPESPPDDDARLPVVELYDLAKDPNEFTNVAADPSHREVRDQLDARLWEFLSAHDDFTLHEPVRTPWQARTHRDLAEHRTRCRTSRPATPRAPAAGVPR